MHENEDTDLNKSLTAEIDTVSSLLSTISLLRKFSSPFEDEFQQDFLMKNMFNVRLTLIIGFILFSLSSLFDLFLIPNWQSTLPVRLYITSPLLLIIVVLSFTPLYHRYLQLLATVFSIITIISLAVLAAIVPVYYKDLLYQSLTLCIVFLTTLTTLEFRYTVIICIIMLIVFNVSYQFSGMTLSEYYYWSLFGGNYILFGVAVVCGIASYFNEMTARKEFILSRLNNIKNILLEHMSRIDGVTGLINRRCLDETLTSEWNRAQRYHYPLAILFTDFDYFKQYNDIYGHQAGDKALHSLGLAFSTCVKRAGDYVGRYGGDEYMIILSNTNREQAIEIAKCIMAQVKKLAIEHKGSKVSNVITLTMGISIIVPTSNDLQFTLVKQADLALQKGKITGRNNIYIYDENEINKIVT